MNKIVFSDGSETCFGQINFEDMPMYIKKCYDDIIEMTIEYTRDVCDTYPKNLKKLKISFVVEVIVISNLPENLENLCVEGCNIGKIEKLPPSLKELHCIHNNLLKLPPLPKNLVRLYCFDNGLTVIPSLPKTLLIFSCSINNLKILPLLPKNLELLICFCNDIKELPFLPKSLKKLHCGFNKLTKLPFLPSCLEEIKFKENNFFDEKLIEYYIDNNMYNKVLRSCEKIGEWFLKIKYNPKYKYCRKRLEKEYEELYK